MRTNVLLVLDTRRPKHDGTYQIILRIVHNQTSAEVRLNHTIHIKDWDEKARKVKSTYKGTESVTRLNNYLDKKKSETIDFITKLDELKELHKLKHATDIKKLVEAQTKPQSFYTYAEHLIKQMEEVGRIGNARSYKSLLTSLKTFVQKDNLLFSQVTYQFLIKLEHDHLKRGNTYNGLAVYMRTIRAICNSAIREGILKRDDYPFTNYTIKTTKTRKRAISIESIASIENLKLLSSHPLFDTRNYFLFSFYMRGMPFADLAQLKKENIINGRIVYQRKKTDKPYNVKLTSEIQSILMLYMNEKSEFIFDIIKRETLQEQYKDIEWARKRYNMKLKDLATLCSIEEKLTSYVSRHSFATRAKNLGIPITTISDMLGHESTKTTEIYMSSLPDDIMDDAHEKIINIKTLKVKNK